jgi:hypothetical protein
LTAGWAAGRFWIVASFDMWRRCSLSDTEWVIVYQIPAENMPRWPAGLRAKLFTESLGRGLWRFPGPETLTSGPKLNCFDLQQNTLLSEMEDCLKPFKLQPTRRTRSLAKAMAIAYSSILFVALSAIAAFASPKATSQSMASGRPTLPSYCQSTTLDGVQFMNMLQAIIAHGDLSDIAFIEKTLGTKFNSYGWNDDGTPAPQKLNGDTINHDAAGIFDNPLQVHLLIFQSEALKKQGNVDRMTFESSSFSNQNQNFISDCLHISISNFSSFYGKGYSIPPPPALPPPAFPPSPEFMQKHAGPKKNGSDITVEGAGIEWQHIQGGDNTKFTVFFSVLADSYNITKDYPVQSITLTQEP